jgi:hypothetical protein
MDKEKLIHCLNTMKDSFTAIARIPDHEEEIKVFIMAYDAAYDILVRDPIIPRRAYPCGQWAGKA